MTHSPIPRRYSSELLAGVQEGVQDQLHGLGLPRHHRTRNRERRQGEEGAPAISGGYPSFFILCL